MFTGLFEDKELTDKVQKAMDESEEVQRKEEAEKELIEVGESMVHGANGVVELTRKTIKAKQLDMLEFEQKVNKKAEKMLNLEFANVAITDELAAGKA